MCIVLTMLTIGLSVTLFFSIRQSLMRIDTLEGEKTTFQERCLSLAKELASAKSTISSLEYENKDLKNKLKETDPEDVDYSYSFDSVSGLMTAIRKNPTAYKNKQVKIVGSICYHWADKNELKLFDLKSSDEYVFNVTYASAQRMFWEEDKYLLGELVGVEFRKDSIYSILKDKDYIKLYGTVRIENGEIYLSDCDFEIISSYK